MGSSQHNEFPNTKAIKQHARRAVKVEGNEELCLKKEILSLSFKMYSLKISDYCYYFYCFLKRSVSFVYSAFTEYQSRSSPFIKSLTDQHGLRGEQKKKGRKHTKTKGRQKEEVEQKGKDATSALGCLKYSHVQLSLAKEYNYVLCQFAKAAITKDHTLAGFKQYKCLFSQSGSQKFKVKVSAGLISSKAPFELGLQMAFFLCLP